mgnify:CR=1 FL=1
MTRGGRDKDRDEPERRCIVTGDVQPKAGLIRFVVSPEGVVVPEGVRVHMCLGAANHDPAQFESPEEFRLDRANGKAHITFGKGVHFCLGAPLSRLEMQIAFERIARRVERIDLVADQAFRYFPSFVLRGLTGLQVRMNRSPQEESSDV